MKLAIFSDIHANLTALQECFRHFKALQLQDNRDATVVILGDYVDYGPRPNETIQFIKTMNPKHVLRGNHENAIFNDESEHFSSARGVESVKYTQSLLNSESLEFMKKHAEGKIEFQDEVGKKILLVHGDPSNTLWGKMPGSEMRKEFFKSFDVVISGHTHFPHFREMFYEVDLPKMRNKKKTIFINPGSVGQPRNHCPHAQYVVFDTQTEEVFFFKVPYDIQAEQKLFSNQVDAFYRDRLELGI